MCDYSLMSLPNRLAAEGEELVVHRFSTGSIGFASAADLNRKAENHRDMSFWRRLKQSILSSDCASMPALCVPPAARLMLRNVDDELRRMYGLAGEEEVKFVQLNADPNTYRDAICCRNGFVLRLQDLPVGQRATVLDLAGDAGEDLPLGTVSVLVG